jgi:HSP20 family protein
MCLENDDDNPPSPEESDTMSNTLDLRRPDAFERVADWLDEAVTGPWFDRVPRKDLIKIEQERGKDALTIRAELPGIDADSDVHVTVVNDDLIIRAERTTRAKEGAYSEFRYGAFARSIPLPHGVHADAISARYADGILTINVPVPNDHITEEVKIKVDKH